MLVAGSRWSTALDFVDEAVKAFLARAVGLVFGALGLPAAVSAAPFQNLDFDSGIPNVVEPLLGVGPNGYGPAADILPGWKLTEQDLAIASCARP
jgi:hypothetical protein